MSATTRYFLYTGNAGYSDARAVNVTFNDAQVTELWRGAGTPPPLPTSPNDSSNNIS